MCVLSLLCRLRQAANVGRSWLYLGRISAISRLYLG